MAIKQKKVGRGTERRGWGMREGASEKSRLRGCSAKSRNSEEASLAGATYASGRRGGDSR